MTAKQPVVRKKALWYYACLAVVLTVLSLWMLLWISREPLHCLRWRFTTHDGTSFQEDIWLTPLTVYPSEPWANRTANLSGQIEVSVPVSAELPWYKLPFQSFRPIKRIPLKNGLPHGSVISLDETGHEFSIQQYREGKEHGIYCFFKVDGSFSHLTSSRDGVMDGPRISCWTNGLLSGADIFSKGKKTGLSRTWDRTGKLIDEGTFDGYQPIGTHTFWLHHNKAKSHEILYTTNGVPEVTTIWASDGSQIGTGTYKEGKMWDGHFAHIFKGYVELDYYSEGKRLKSNLEWLSKSTKQ
ncbi:MAG TPA: hypothetical protein VGH19_02080 [Verrucomicrobiae bacterium]